MIFLGKNPPAVGDPDARSEHDGEGRSRRDRRTGRGQANAQILRVRLYRQMPAVCSTPEDMPKICFPGPKGWAPANVAPSPASIKVVPKELSRPTELAVGEWDVLQSPGVRPAQ